MIALYLSIVSLSPLTSGIVHITILVWSSKEHEGLLMSAQLLPLCNFSIAVSHLSPDIIKKTVSNLFISKLSPSYHFLESKKTNNLTTIRFYYGYIAPKITNEIVL